MYINNRIAKVVTDSEDRVIFSYKPANGTTTKEVTKVIDKLIGINKGAKIALDSFTQIDFNEAVIDNKVYITSKLSYTERHKLFNGIKTNAKVIIDTLNWGI